MAEKPEKHHSDLVLCHAIIAICDNSLFYTDSARHLSQKIIKLCSEEAAKQLRFYDRAVKEQRR